MSNVAKHSLLVLLVNSRAEKRNLRNYYINEIFAKHEKTFPFSLLFAVWMGKAKKKAARHLFCASCSPPHAELNIKISFPPLHTPKLKPEDYFRHKLFLCIVMSFVFSSTFPFYPSTPVSKAKILGNQELFIKSGNDINLTCTTSQVSSPPSFIYWYKGGRVVNYSQRGGINVSTDRTTKTSNLIISRASPSDSGNYTCAPSNSGKLIK